MTQHLRHSSNHGSLRRRVRSAAGQCSGLVLHTLALNPMSHALFMQGQIGETHFNSLVIGMGIEALLMIICALSTWFVLRSPGQLS